MGPTSPFLRLLIALKPRQPSADMNIMRERRSEVRMLCADMVKVDWRAGGRTHRSMALLEDISPSGACLQLEMAIPPGTTICWQCPRRQFSGKVQYCVYREIGYFVGVAFDRESTWSQGTYKPQHMLDPQDLIDKAKK